MNDIGRPRHLAKVIAIESEFCAKMDGEFYAEAFQCREMMDGRSIEIPGTRRVAVLPTHNLILNNALEYYGGNYPSGHSNQFSVVHVGTNSTAETITDTALFGYLASAQFSADMSLNFAYVSGSPIYWGARRKRARFNPNFGGGDVNISELGVSGFSGSLNSAQTGGYFTARALTRDSAGDPTSVPVLSTEYLDVWYTRRIYPSLIVDATGAPADGTGSIDIDGVSYNYTIRPAGVTSSGRWGYSIDDAFNGRKGTSAETNCGTIHQYPATLGGVTGTPSSADQENTGLGASTLGAYTPFSYNRDVIWTFGLDDAVWGSGIGGFMMETTMGAYQCILNAGVPKTNEQTFKWYCNFAWTRKTIP